MSRDEANWRVLARELTGWELMGRVEDGHDIALLPVGSLEMHGPQLPLGTDTYIAEAVCRLVAPRIKGTVFDTVSYTWPGMTKYSFPTVSMTMDMETRYVRMVCDQLLRIGFRRIYVVQFHGPGIALQRLAREFFEETGVPLVFYGLMRMPDAGRDHCRERGIAWEASLCAGAAEVLDATPTIDSTAKPSDGKAEPPPGAEARKEIIKTGGFVGGLGTDDLHHGPFDGQLDAQAGINILEGFARSISSSAPHVAEMGHAWKDIDLETSWPSTIRTTGEEGR